MEDVLHAILNDAARFLLKAVILIVIGVILANILMESGIIERFTPFLLPFCRASNLPKECVSSLITCFINPTAGKAMLAGFYQSGKIGERESLLTAIMATFPIVAGESLFRGHALLAIFILGPFIGTVYMMLNLLSAFLQSLIAFFIARYTSQRSHHSRHSSAQSSPSSRLHASHNMHIASVLMNSIRKSAKTLKKIVPTFIIAFLIIDLLLISGGMNAIGSVFEPILRILDIPGECISAIIADLIHFSAGYATVVTLLNSGIINAKQAILTLLVGSMLTITIIYVKHSFSMYVSLFGRLGVKISVANYTFSVLTKLLMIAIVIHVS